MKLAGILRGVDIVEISGDAGIGISGIAYDSRKVTPGNLFVAVRGEHTDGHDFIGDAIKNGAVAILHDKDINSDGLRTRIKGEHNARDLDGLTVIRVSNSREALAIVSNNFFMRPSHRLSVIGVTGTNGKTTTAYIIKSILEAWDRKTGLTGTIQHMLPDEVREARHTTPESLEFQGLLYNMLASGCTHVVSEISSHALSQGRVDGTVFSAAVFTNLTRDHLDFHKTMENYFMSKTRLFTALLDESATAVINSDDPWGRKLIETLSGNVLTYGLGTDTDIMATDIASSFDGLRFKIVMRGRKHSVTSPLTGLPNVYNILSSAAAATALGVPWSVILDGIKKAGTITGRFEKVDAGQGFLAIVDYAHTEDALERLIYTARGLTKGKIITVFGCGGDRDRGKREVMGSIATRLSDSVIITSDNPRSEDPEKIIREIVSGAVRKNFLIEADRREAIKRSVMMASDGDVVLVAGKGHEVYQEIKGERFEFSDRKILEETISRLINNI
ncbi:MAG: UDP-N-acetylmuramoyl-L-alanyl-D-glutamate--2,6-diaminopimelate ligase [Nitrospirota bacterium]|nr:UDP-N-acetylmuramoyl-L-alanyl-D-glutamate--2,6-diaminopimelate ligase [Nitrospirota bacterium]